MSGKSNVIFWLQKRGIEPAAERRERIFAAAKQSARVLTEEEVWALIAEPAEEASRARHE